MRGQTQGKSTQHNLPQIQLVGASADRTAQVLPVAARAKVEVGVAGNKPGLTSVLGELARRRVFLQHLLGDQASNLGQLEVALRATGLNHQAVGANDVTPGALVDGKEQRHF